MSGSKKKGTFVTVYWMSLHMAIARCIDELLEIEVGKKRLWWGSVKNNQRMRFDERFLFGGDSKEGGIMGNADLLMGRADQQHGGLAEELNGYETAFRGVASLYYYGTICANSPNPKPWRFRIRHHEQGWDDGQVWYPEKIAIWQASGQVKGMNPAHIMYLLWTGRDFRGIDKARLDANAWRTFADQLYNEGFGLCFKLDRQCGIDEFMNQVIEHIGAAQYVSRHTGKIVPVLIRDGYNASDLPLFTPDTGLLGIDEYASDALSGAINEVIVNYKDPLDKGNKRQVREKNLGSINALGGVVNSTTIDYPGIPTAALARRVARRDLTALSGFVRRFKVRLDRRATRYAVPSGLIRISDPERGIESMVLRLGKIDNGSFKSGVIVVDAALDIYGMPHTVFIPEEPNGHIPPDPKPVLIAAKRLIEAPYRDLVEMLGAAVAEALTPEAGFVGAMAIKPTALSSQYILHDRIASVGNYKGQAKGLFCTSATLEADVAELDTSAVLVASNELMLITEGTAALLGDEIVHVKTIDQLTGAITIERGCVDTVPTKHAAGTRMWFYEGYTVDDSTEYSKGVALEVKLQPETVMGQLPLDQVTPELFTFKGRAARPYPPGQFKINGEDYPQTIDSKELTISWAHRNRLTQAEYLIDTTQGNITPEAGTTYTLELFRISDGALLDRETGITSTEHTFTNAYAGNVRVVLKSVRNGLESWQAHSHVFEHDVQAPTPLTWDSTNITWDSTDTTFDQTER